MNFLWFRSAEITVGFHMPNSIRLTWISYAARRKRGSKQGYRSRRDSAGGLGRQEGGKRQ